MKRRTGLLLPLILVALVVVPALPYHSQDAKPAIGSEFTAKVTGISAR